MARDNADPLAPLNTFIFGGNDGLSYEELKRRRAIATALAARQRGFPKNLGEGLTYFGESVGEAIGDWRLREMEARQRAGDTAALTPPGASGASSYPPADVAPPPADVAPPPADVAPPPADVAPPPADVAPPPPAQEPPVPINPALTPGPVSDAPAGPPAGTATVAPPSSPVAGRFNAAFAPTREVQQVAQERGPAQPGPRDLLFNPQRAQGGIMPNGMPQADFAVSPTYSQDQVAALNAPLSPVQPPPEQAQAPSPPPQGAQGPMQLPLAAGPGRPVDPRAPVPGAMPAQAAPQPPPPQPQAGGAPFEGPMQDPRVLARQNAIRGIESGGSRDPYAMLHARTPSGDRAQGAYGIMGRNVPKWTKDALGYSVTPEQFRGNRNIQDITFNNRFGGYANKYGEEGAARAWYAGEKGMKNLNATDQHGRLTVAGYGQDFSRRMGGANPRDTVTAALMQQQQGPPTEREIASEALMQDVIGMGRGRGGSYPATASLGRAGVGTDAPLPGISPLGSATDEGVANAVRDRQNIYNAVQQQQINAPAPAPEGPQADPTLSGVTPPTTPTSSPVSTGDKFAQAQNVGTITDTGMVIGGPRVPAQDIRALPRDPAQGIRPVPSPQVQPSEPSLGLPPRPNPGPEPTLQGVTTPEMQRHMDHYRSVATDRARSDDVRKIAEDRYNELKRMRDADYTRRWTSWSQIAKEQREYDQKLPELREDLRKKRLDATKAEQNLPSIAPPPQPGSAPDPRLGTPNSPQRSRVPTASAPPPNTDPETWRKDQTTQAAKSVEAVDRAAPMLEDALRTIHLARTHPGRDWGLGAPGKIARSVPGTDAAGFGAIVEQLRGKNFLAGYQLLKGAGPVSEIEGLKTEAAQARVDPNQKKEDFDMALRDLETQLRRDLETMQRKVNAPVTAWRPAGDNHSFAPDVGQIGVRGNNRVRYIGGNPADDASYQVVQ